MKVLNSRHLVMVILLNAHSPTYVNNRVYRLSYYAYSSVNVTQLLIGMDVSLYSLLHRILLKYPIEV